VKVTWVQGGQVRRAGEVSGDGWRRLDHAACGADLPTHTAMPMRSSFIRQCWLSTSPQTLAVSQAGLTAFRWFEDLDFVAPATPNGLVITGRRSILQPAVPLSMSLHYPKTHPGRFDGSRRAA
jgi:hypothetical protein